MFYKMFKSYLNDPDTQDKNDFVLCVILRIEYDYN